MISKSEWDKLKKEDSEALRDIILNECKGNETLKIAILVLVATVLVMILNYFGLEAWGEKWLR